MDARFTDGDNLASWSGLLGYLNFSVGKPDARFQKQLSDACRFLAGHGAAPAWRALAEQLPARLAELQASGAAAFKETDQAGAVIRLVFDHLLPAYKQHHADLLFHQTEADLFQPFFLARAFEAVLAQGGLWDEAERVTRGALTRLNDYVGYRPIAVLESRPKGEPYDHERVRPIPLYLKGAGAAFGPYEAVLNRALEILQGADAGLLQDACLDLNLLDEFALDPRAYDHGHPVNRRPNYVFGEWDPHHLDNQGRYRRYVARQLTMDALLARTHQKELLTDPDELLYEAAAVLAGTVLMATGLSGTGPGYHDSTQTLSKLVKHIARYRDAFYAALIKQVGGAHGERLRAEAQKTRQPFGGARQHLNQFLAQHRALQLQQRHLALLFATMGYADASRAQAARIPVASLRFLSEIFGRLSTGHLALDRGRLADAARVLPEIDDLIHRGIACGALADPWNVLAFQGQFPLFQAIEDGLHDGRIDELLQVQSQYLTLSARVLSEAAAKGDKGLQQRLTRDLRKTAAWWDRFATYEVSGVLRVHGGEAADSAEHVATALSRWHAKGAAAADLPFWRQHLEGFTTPKAFALVIDALLRQQDHKAAMALLMAWLSQAEAVPLEEGDHAFHTLALRWMLSVGGHGDAPPPEPAAERAQLVHKFFALLEANADDYWEVPDLRAGPGAADDADEEEADEEEDDLYGAAYEGMTYKDSTDDGTEGSVAEGGPPPAEEFDLEAEGQRLGKRLRFLGTVARLWQVAVRSGLCEGEGLGVPEGWLEEARAKRDRLLPLLDDLYHYPIGEPSDAQDGYMEFDRRRSLKTQLLDTALGACLDMALAVRVLQGAILVPAGDAAAELPHLEGAPDWEPLAIRLEQAVIRGHGPAAAGLLPEFVERFKGEPLLYTPLEDGGHPRQILRTRLAQVTLRVLLEGLPRLGLLRETYHLLHTARDLEQNGPTEGRRVTEFDRLFQPAFQAVVETVVESSATWDPRAVDPATLVNLLQALTESFLKLWIAHSQTLRLSALEAISSPEDVRGVFEFIRQYGKDLFTSKFLNLGNLRGVLGRGVGPFLDQLAANPDPLHPIKLIEALGHQVPKERAVRFLEWVLQAVAENYEEYKDYNTTTTHSDYGDNLHILLDFLRLKAGYERHAWNYRPLVLAHEVLARKGRTEAAVLWQEAFVRATKETARRHAEELARLEQTHGTRLRTVADRIEERFVKPLAVDRLCALIEPAMEEARQEQPGQAFARLLEELRPYAEQATGVGLDVPAWLRKLEWEAHRVRAGRTAIAGLAQNLFRLPRTTLSLDDLRRQVAEWDRPLWRE